MSATTATLNPSDLYRVDDLLTGDEKLVQQTVRMFVTDRVLPHIAEHFEAGTFPRELITGLANLGVLGMHLTGYNCAGASAVAYGVACEELEAGDSGIRSFVSVQGSLCMFPIWRFGSETQKNEWLPRMATGEVIGCFGLTESDAGSDPAAMRTYAKRDGSDWILNGGKMWITSGGMAHLAVIWAQTDEGIRGFLVDTKSKGFSANEITRKMSLRASVTSELVLDSVRVPESMRLPHALGLRGPLSCLNEARYGIAWGVMGAARACYEAAVDYSRERKVMQKSLAAFQLTQAKLAEMATQLVAGRLIAHRLGVLKDAEEIDPVQVSLAKRNNVRAAMEIARSARTILGANGITLEYPVARHMANLEAVLTYEGTEEVHTLILGKAITGEDAFA